MDMAMAEQRNNTHFAERVDAQTQTETSTAEDLTLSQKLTPIAHHELQVESAAQPAPPPPPPSSTTTPNTPLDKFDKDILRWKDVHFLRDFGDWFDPEKAVQPTYTRLLASCGYFDPLDPGEDHIPPLDFVDSNSPLGVDVVENSDTSISNQNGRALISPDVMITGNDTNVERDFVPESELEDATAVEHTATLTATDTISTGSTQTSRLPTVTVGSNLDSTSVGDNPNPNPDSDSDSTVLVESSMN